MNYKIITIVTILLLTTLNAKNHHNMSTKITPKVVVITLFPPERDAWLKYKFTNKYKIKGLKGKLYYNKKTKVAMFKSGIGLLNSAASTMAVILDKRFDFSKSYIVISGIAGGPPNKVTMGSSYLEDYTVEVSTSHLFDYEKGSEITYTPMHCPYNGTIKSAFCKSANSGIDYKVFKFNSKLNKKVLNHLKGTSFTLTKTLIKGNKLYGKDLKVTEIGIGTNTSGLIYFHGKRMSEINAMWVKRFTNGKGEYFTSAMEDSAVFEVVNRLSKYKLVDRNRMIAIRTISNYDRPPKGVAITKWFSNHESGYAFALLKGQVVSLKAVNYLLTLKN